MTARLIDGNAIGKKIRAQLKEKVSVLIASGRRNPCLAVILVGDDPASQVYVRHKEKACDDVGIKSKTFHLRAATPENEVLALITKLNQDPEVDGILPQLPMPPHIDRVRIISAINPEKDVDGLSFYNQGRLAWNLPALIPCTPAGVMELLKHENIDCGGKKAVVIGRSVLVGLPLQLLLTHANATVTCVHSKTKNPELIARDADILVAAAGSKHLVTKEWIKPGAVVIDVGIHKNDDGKLTGDVRPEDAIATASFFTPVPGGVGPMTIAMLMVNCVQAYEKKS